MTVNRAAGTGSSGAGGPGSYMRPLLEFLSEFAAMDMDERWVNRSPETMLDTFHWFRGEGFDLIVEDLQRLARETCVIAEGFRLLPRHQTGGTLAQGRSAALDARHVPQLASLAMELNEHPALRRRR